MVDKSLNEQILEAIGNIAGHHDDVARMLIVRMAYRRCENEGRSTTRNNLVGYIGQIMAEVIYYTANFSSGTYLPEVCGFMNQYPPSDCFDASVEQGVPPNASVAAPAKSEKAKPYRRMVIRKKK